MRTFKFEEIGRICCRQDYWKEMYEEFVKLKGRTTFTFFDVVTNLSIDDYDFSEVVCRIFSKYFNIDIDDFEEWLFGYEIFSMFDEFDYYIAYREIIYTLIIEKKYERLIKEYILEKNRLYYIVYL